MTHDEKLEIVIRAINNTKPKKEPHGLCFIDLYQNAHKELSQFDELELFNLIQDLGRYGFSVVIVNSPLGTGAAWLEETTNEPPTDYFELNLMEYPLNINFFKDLDSSLEGLYYPTFLILYDLLLDIEEIYGTMERNPFLIPLLPTQIRLPEAYENMPKLEIMSARERAIYLLQQYKIIKIEGYHYREDDSKTEADIILYEKLFKRYLDKAKAIYIKNTTIKQELQKVSGDEEVAYCVTYSPAREIIIHGDHTSFILTKLNFGGENDAVFGYLDQHPNIIIDKKTLVQTSGGNLTKTLPKIVEKLGFSGNLLRAFFNVNETSVLYRKSITHKELEEMGIDKLLPPKNKKVKV